MVKSLYSGVAGMTTHQTKMDVIGNNIANVSTYGYKSSRATFRDMFYQTSTAASSASALTGGTNAAQVGSGTTLGSVDVNHSQSIMTTTGYSLDVAITGEGYLQVMDTDGNIFYTKAGMLDIDSAGNLVDVNGNFVLGVSGTTANQLPGSNKIQINLPYEEPSVSSATETINDVQFTFKSSNESSLSNLALGFTSSTDMPYNQKVKATVTNGEIAITLNANEEFESLAELQELVNKAITSANGGQAISAGDIEISADTNIFMDENGDAVTLTGAEIVGTNFGVNLGSVSIAASDGTSGTTSDISNYFTISGVGDDFSTLAGEDASTNAIDFVNNDDGTYTISIGGVYSATLTEAQMATAGSVVLKGADDTVSTYDTDTITVTFPKLSKFPKDDDGNVLGLDGTVTMEASAPSKEAGLSSTTFNLTGGTEGGKQTVADLTGLAIGSDGVITGSHPTLGVIELGRIDLATFDNPAGLTQAGDTYFAESANSGAPKLSIPGSENTGALAAGSLETSNVDLSQEMADMITTQRGFQANSRIITVSDSMLEELINLKR